MSQYAIEKKAPCRRRRVKVPKGRRSFCSDACVHEHKLRSDPGYLREQAFQRDTEHSPIFQRGFTTLEAPQRLIENSIICR
jgi:hypothetical protein